MRDAGITVEVVPGISAALAASADIGQSLTQRGMSRSAVFVTPCFGDGESNHDWARVAATADTVALYMASRQAAAISGGLIAAGVPASRPAVFVENASLPSRRVVATRVGKLSAGASELGDGPALLLIGDVYAEIVAAAEQMESGATRWMTA